jgi:transcriptional regulator with XRE-family HTH domain
MTVQPSASPSEISTASGTCGEPSPEYRVAVLSSLVLTLTRLGCGESQDEFAIRAGVALEAVTGAENGSQPAWAMAYDEFNALADATAAFNSDLRVLFETATACDLLLSCILNGDQVLAADVIVEPRSRDAARVLLKLAITGDVDRALPVPELARRPETVPFLGDSLVALLCDRAAALAASGSPDAWVGEEILAAWRGGQS